MQNGSVEMVVLLVLVVALTYFLMIRPQSKKQKEHRTLLSNLAKGDEVLTNGGLVGKITKLSPDSEQVMVEIAPNCEVQISRNFVVSVLPKGTMKALRNA